MAVLYRLSKNNNQYNAGYGQWYAQSVMTETVDTDKLATIMQRNCTVKKSDILAVITELIETMQDQLQNSKRVKLNGFGSFKIGISGEGANKAEDFSAGKNIKDLHVLFQPEVKKDGNGLRQKTFITGCTVQEAPKNEGKTSKPVDNGGSNNGGGNSGNGGSSATPSDEPDYDQPSGD